MACLESLPEVTPPTLRIGHPPIYSASSLPTKGSGQLCFILQPLISLVNVLKLLCLGPGYLLIWLRRGAEAGPSGLC